MTDNLELSAFTRWARTLAPLPAGHECVSCRRPAVVGTMDGWRCADCPPAWGQRLSWGRRPPGSYCAPARCYCGLCEHYQPPATARPASITVAAEVARTDLQLANALRATDGAAQALAVLRARRERRGR